MRYIFLDIETVPLQIKDDYVIRYLMNKKLTDASRSLDPNYSRIIVIGVKYEDNSRLFSGEEKQILIDFWNFIRENDGIIVTHNGCKFDIPFIIARSIANSVKITKEINFNPWSAFRGNHIDVMLVFSQNVFVNSGLRILAKLNNIEFEDENITGKDVERLYNEGRLDEIKKHCEKDIEILEKLFNKRCKNYIEKI